MFSQALSHHCPARRIAAAIGASAALCLTLVGPAFSSQSDDLAPSPAAAAGQSPQVDPATMTPTLNPNRKTDMVAFMRPDMDGHWQVWVANSDLSAAKQLTFENANSGWPVWSPNGRKIAFDSDRSDPNPADESFINDVFTMNADGSSVTNLTKSRGGVSGDPGWSRDGSLIAFESDGDGYPHGQGIYIMRPDGSDIRRVTSLPAHASFDHAPRFSPDGTRLVFTRDADGSALFTTDLNGHTAQITSFAIGAGDAVWSPDGQRIVFEAYPDPTSRGDVYVVNSNGKRLRNLTENALGDGSADPVWSPDGSKILFLEGRHIPQPDRTIGLAAMSADGSDRHFIEDNPIESHQPDWIRASDTR